MFGCYNDKLFSSCFYTDIENPNANDFNEYAYAGHQKQDGTFFLFGETQNRGVFTPSNVTDDYFLRANLDDFGNVQPIADYVHTNTDAAIRYDDHIMLEMNPPFTTVTSPMIVFSNSQETGTPNHDIQVTFFETDVDCIESTLNWTMSPNSSEFTKDVIQASSDDLIVLGECYDHATPNVRRPFLFGFDITGNQFANKKLNLIAPDGSDLGDITVNAITEFTDGSGNQRYAVVGKINNRVLFFELDANLNLIGPYQWFDIDNDPVTQEEAIDIAFDPQDNSLVITGTIFQPLTPTTQPYMRIFVSKLNLQGLVQWTNMYNIPGGGENVREMHLNERGQIAIVGSCEIPEGFVLVGAPRNDISYLLKTDRDGNFLLANKYDNAAGNQPFDLEYCIDKGYLLTGSCWRNYPDPNGGPLQSVLQNHDIWTVKTDSLGLLGPDAETCVTPTDVVLINPDYTREINEIWEEEIDFEGGNYDYNCISYVHEQEICTQYCPLPPNEICAISSTFTQTQTDSCCVVSLDLTNNMTAAYQIRIEIKDPDLPPVTPTTTYFDWTSTTAPFCIVPQSSNEVIVEMCSGAPLPTGLSTDYFEFCLADSLGTAPSQEIRLTYLNTFGLPFAGCVEEFEVECPVVEEPCYELIVDTVRCAELPGVFDLCFTVKNNDILDSLAFVSFNAGSSGVLFSPNQVSFSPPIAPGATSSIVCVQIFDPTGLPLPRQITIGHDAHDRLYEYCCLGDSLDIVLPNCCEPCVPDWVVVSPDSLGADSCCFALDFRVGCPLSLKQLRVESITPGVEINNVVLGGPNATDWNLSTTNTTAVLNPNGTPTAASGFYDDLLNFCLNDTVGVPIQEVVVSYIGCTPLGADTILCQDTLQFNCEIETDCIEIVEDFVYCDEMGNYFLDFCVKNVSNPSFHANELVINNLGSSGLVITPDRFYPISLPVDGIFCGTVQILGFPPNVPSPGQQIQLGFALHQNLGIEYDTCCVDEQELLVILPECEPMGSECCENIDIFQNLASQTSITYAGGLAVVANPNLNDCHFLDIDWGDGFGVNHTAASNLPLSHSYAAPGSYTINVLVYEESPDGTLCFEFGLSQTISAQLVPIETNVQVFPNPVVNELSVQLSNQNDEDQTVEIRTMTGVLVHRSLLKRGTTYYTVDASEWGTGVYTVSILNELGLQSSHKVVKVNR